MRTKRAPSINRLWSRIHSKKPIFRSNKKGEPAFALYATTAININASRLCSVLAEWTGLEPATSGVTGRYSNRLNYHSESLDCNRSFIDSGGMSLVGAEGFEPPTYAL